MYGVEHRKLQKEFDSVNLADRVEETIVSSEIDDFQRTYIVSRDMFFITTINHLGQPTVSYKGGRPGLLTVIDNNNIIFPSYDGNGMYLTAGNIVGNENIGILLIDFETPFRIRIAGRANRSMDPAHLKHYHEAQLVFNVRVDKIWINCNRYIHPHKRLETSKYAPEVGVETPFPAWKRIDEVCDVLPFDQGDKVKAAGGKITPEEWMEKIQNKNA